MKRASIDTEIAVYGNEPTTATSASAILTKNDGVALRHSHLVTIMPRDRRYKITSLRVGSEYELPAFYVTATTQETELALQLGATMVEASLSKQAGDEMRALEERHAAELAAARMSHSAALTAIQTELATAQEAAATARAEHTRRHAELLEAQKAAESLARKEERELVTKQAEVRIRTLEGEISIASERVAALQERRAQLEQSRDQDIRVAEERTKMLLQTTLEEKERGIQRAEKTLQTMQAAYERQTEELRTLGDLIRRKPTNVKSKGTEYEEIFRAKLIAAFGTGERFALTDSARNGVGHAGDYLMQWGEHTVLWEVKNYDRVVPTAEVDKFRRDMKENAHVRVGVMISRYTAITNKVATGDRTVEFVEGKMLIYLSNFEAMSEDALQSLLLLFRLWWESDKNIEESESKEATIRAIERLHTATLKAKTEWRLHKSRAEEMLRWMSETVEETEERLNNALKALQGTATTQIAIPENIFRDSIGDEKAQAMIQLVLEFTEPAEDGSCILNDISEAVGKKKALSRDTAKSHIRAVLLDSAIEPPKGKYPARVKGLVLKPPTNVFVE